jgi:hypothetical protein
VGVWLKWQRACLGKCKAQGPEFKPQYRKKKKEKKKEKMH